MMVWWLLLLFCTAFADPSELYVDELRNELEESSDNQVLVQEDIPAQEDVAIQEKAPAVESNIMESDLMAVASPPQIEEQSTEAPRDKRQDDDQLIDIMAAPIANEHVEELTAYLHATEKVKRNTDKFSMDNTKGELNSIFTQIHAAKRNKLTRSDIRKLAKKALILATLQKVKSKETKKSNTPRPIKSPSKNSEHKSTKKQPTKTNKSSKAHKSKKSKVKTSAKSSKKKAKANAEISSTLKSAAAMEGGKGISDANMANGMELSDSDVHEDTDDVMKKQVLSVAGEDTNKERDSVGETVHTQKSEFNSEEFKMMDASHKSDFSDQSMMELAKKSDITTPAPTTTTTTISTTSTEKPAEKSTTEKSTTSTSTEKSTTTEKVSEEKKSNIEKPKIINDDDLSNYLIDTKDEVARSKIEGSKENGKTKSSIEKPDKLTIAATTDKSLNLEDYVDFGEVKMVKKTEVPTSQEVMDNKIDTLRSVLNRASTKKVPSKFLPDLPAGIRMIAWKELIKKKKGELEDLVAAAETRATISAKPAVVASPVDKPVTIDIDISQDKTEKDMIAASSDKKDTTTGDLSVADDTTDDKPKKKEEEMSSHHIKYLKSHLKGARSLRKLIAKTLIGHCKSTGKRILEAFVAMDKALARAQAIADVIGKKFHVNNDNISELVHSKEDEVVETFLRDIFTKLNR